ncbi:hypothetical protein CI109_100384 [Kwoniella shandongensis]|uniref:Uncharacterized protein n=1 Tax=Kwoniella shandongensis TaxID=1734106 RepID=A0A5M6C4D2_9TREE|nr:uncharacterized protein CI109_001773 [Kwoniella shandongensis]KAA5529833.1 hypothetical protein CI109_001773 [Kwoniella shandongensis]
MSSASSRSQQPIFSPATYKATRNEVGVFTTPPYSEKIKPLWRFQDSVVARASAEAIWERFQGYRDQDDFVGMDITRKFLQMGRTRSLRYALRPGGRKYSPTSGEEMARTGKVYDEEKRKGAEVFEGYVDKCWADEVYSQAYASWAEEGKKVKSSSTRKIGGRGAAGKGVGEGKGDEKGKNIKSEGEEDGTKKSTAKRKRRNSESDSASDSDRATSDHNVEEKPAKTPKGGQTSSSPRKSSGSRRGAPESTSTRRSTRSKNS